ncbi:hypothetical protein K461DRAFT_272167 [Myriangium duriaei CBS 260.36]|uniref:Uncharacterized protein n=1 Tax=Myriangium duriaei CBS 260.36 TaxID=1168546 RepID=A0A9P4MC99_9PEZI|nr:hypothetical protein K461DRAFT_272167 [Myriangium duriaei CBS 260.36]
MPGSLLCLLMEQFHSPTNGTDKSDRIYQKSPGLLDGQATCTRKFDHEIYFMLTTDNLALRSTSSKHIMPHRRTHAISHLDPALPLPQCQYAPQPTIQQAYTQSCQERCQQSSYMAARQPPPQITPSNLELDAPTSIQSTAELTNSSSAPASHSSAQAVSQPRSQYQLHQWQMPPGLTRPIRALPTEQLMLEATALELDMALTAVREWEGFWVRMRHHALQRRDEDMGTYVQEQIEQCRRLGMLTEERNAELQRPLSTPERDGSHGQETQGAEIVRGGNAYGRVLLMQYRSEVP